MDDVAEVIAAHVVEDVDGFLWDWDDVAAAAAALRACSDHPLPHAVSAALWRAVAAADPAAQRKACKLSSTCVGATKENLLALARAARLVGVRTSMRIDALAPRLSSSMPIDEFKQRLAERQAPVGPSCPVAVSAALGVLRLRWRWANSSAVKSAYGAAVDTTSCRSAGAQYRGTRLLLRDVRAAARRVIAAGTDAAACERLRQAAAGHRRAVEQAVASERRSAQAAAARDGRRRELQLAVASAGLPVALLDHSESRAFVLDGGDVAQLIAQMRACVGLLHEAGLVCTEDMVWRSGSAVCCGGLGVGGLLRWARSEVRSHRLADALGARGLAFRGVSHVFCAQYVAGDRDDVEDVVETMDEMRFYYTQTAYAKLLQRPRRRLWDGWGRAFDVDDDDSDSDEFDPIEASRIAKVAALRRLGSVPANSPAYVRRLADVHGVPVSHGA